MKVVAVAIVFISFVASFASASRVCGNVYVWRNENMTCPDTNTICADVFTTTRDWRNGTTCAETRVLHNCMCPGNQICPTNNPDYKLYASQRQTRYTCQPACSLPWCANSNNIYPLTMVQRGQDFGDRAYTKIGCRCPGHHFPGSGRARATRVHLNGWDGEYMSPVQRYVCTGSRDDASDPCPPMDPFGRS